MDYQRTALGDKEILQRTFKLSVRCRSLLLLLQSKDFNALNQSALNKIATIENYQELLNLGLIERKSSISESDSIDQINQTNIIDHPQSQNIESKIVDPIDNKKITSTSADQIQIIKDAEILEKIKQEPVIKQKEIISKHTDLTEIKLIMINTLKAYCGLMSKNLYEHLEQAETVDDIRQHQAKWLTTLSETRMCKDELARMLSDINQHLLGKELLNIK